jgi:hypothetical protein
LEQSFAAYKMTAELRIEHLEKSSRLWKWGCVILGAAAAGATAWAITR